MHLPGCRGCLTIVATAIIGLAFLSIAARVPVWQTILVGIACLVWITWRRASGPDDVL